MIIRPILYKISFDDRFQNRGTVPVAAAAAAAVAAEEAGHALIEPLQTPPPGFERHTALDRYTIQLLRGDPRIPVRRLRVEHLLWRTFYCVAQVRSRS